MSPQVFPLRTDNLSYPQVFIYVSKQGNCIQSPKDKKAGSSSILIDYESKIHIPNQVTAV